MTLLQGITRSPYARLMRLHQPAGIWLLLWPCAWSVTLASHALRPDLLLAFAVGAACMRPAGCIINDIWDRAIDREVERTRARPLASGELRLPQALALLALLLLLALAVAAYLGIEVVLWAAASLPLVTLYPLMKRITWWPQAFLALTFNWGALLGSVAVTGAVTLPALLLYAAGCCWTLGYDTAYAVQDMSDDARIGVRSSALYLGKRTRNGVAGFYAAMLALLAAAGAFSGAHGAYYLALVIIGIYLFKNVSGLSIDTPASGRAVFLAAPATGLAIFCACLIAII